MKTKKQWVKATGVMLADVNNTFEKETAVISLKKIKYAVSRFKAEVGESYFDERFSPYARAWMNFQKRLGLRSGEIKGVQCEDNNIIDIRLSISNKLVDFLFGTLLKRFMVIEVRWKDRLYIASYKNWRKQHDEKK